MVQKEKGLYRAWVIGKKPYIVKRVGFVYHVVINEFVYDEWSMRQSEVFAACVMLLDCMTGYDPGRLFKAPHQSKLLLPSPVSNILDWSAFVFFKISPQQIKLFFFLLYTLFEECFFISLYDKIALKGVLNFVFKC